MELNWCIDRENNIWFVHTVHPHVNDHREVWTGEDFFVLHYQGKNIEIVLRRVSEESSVKIVDNPFKVVWKLDRIKEEDLKDFDYQEIVSLLREILSIYGWKGSRLEKHVPQKNLSVELRV